MDYGVETVITYSPFSYINKRSNNQQTKYRRYKHYNLQGISLTALTFKILTPKKIYKEKIINTKNDIVLSVKLHHLLWTRTIT